MVLRRFVSLRGYPSIIYSDNGSQLKSTSKELKDVIKKTSEDIICFKIKLNFSPKRNKRRTGSDIELGELNNKFPSILTRRDVIAQVNGFFDPLGLASPVTVAAKIMVRKLWIGEMKGYGWDDPIPEKLYEMWKIFFQGSPTHYNLALWATFLLV